VYGAHVAGEIALGVADRGWTVVSGGAYGVDGAAHGGALLSTSGGTIAVLACGVDVAYPRGHTRLLEQIATDQLLISEHPPGCAPTRSRFLIRNRLIASLASGTVVVEAALRSGSLTTARQARDLGRHLMAVPGPVTSAMSAGCHKLLRAGAVCVTSAAEVLDTVGELTMDASPELRGPTSPRDGLSDAVRQVLDAVPVRKWAGPASIAKAAGVPTLTVQAMLPPLQVAGLVEQSLDGWRLTPLGANRPARAAS
jgi:DNA processing protein